MHMPARSHGLIFPAPDPSSSGARRVAVFNVGIALLLMELGVYRVFEDITGIYAVAATSRLGSVVADITLNKWLKLRPAEIEFRRAYLYDINPVGIGSMTLAMLCGLSARMGWLGHPLQVLPQCYRCV